MALISDPTELPPRIRAHLVSAGILDDGVIAAVKTAYKPNATIPILWLIIHKGGVTFCCTHRTRGIFKQLQRGEIDSIRLKEPSGLGSPILEVIHAELGEDDFAVPLPPDADVGGLRDLLISERYQVL